MNLNLANKYKSAIDYDLVNFPDGHKHINLKPNHHLKMAKSISIQTRIVNYDDIFVLKQAVSQLRQVNFDVIIHLEIVYLLAARYDRPMHDGDSFDLKIVCDDINALNFRTVVITEPHSNVATSLIDRVSATYPLNNMLTKVLADLPDDEVCFVVPDLGAVKRVESFLGALKRDIPIVYSNKHRVISTGEITGIDTFNPDLLRKTAIVYDDLCDGGRTFIELAKAIRGVNAPETARTPIVQNIFLFVTHGLFSKGVKVLLDKPTGWTDKPQDALGYVNRIYTTNSYQDHEALDGYDGIFNVTEVI